MFYSRIRSWSSITSSFRIRRYLLEIHAYNIEIGTLCLWNCKYFPVLSKNRPPTIRISLFVPKRRSRDQLLSSVCRAANNRSIQHIFLLICIYKQIWKLCACIACGWLVVTYEKVCSCRHSTIALCCEGSGYARVRAYCAWYLNFNIYCTLPDTYLYSIYLCFSSK